jgi:signal transduction histidine kinase
MSLRRKIIGAVLAAMGINFLIVLLCVALSRASFISTVEGGANTLVDMGADLKAGIGTFFIGALAGAVFISGVIYLSLSRLVLTPLQRLLDCITRVPGSGKISIPPTTENGDEINTLLKAFSKMAEEVNHTREHLEERVDEATEKVQKVQRQLAFKDRLAATGKLAAGVAHEINNPLSGVINAVDRIGKKEITQEKKQEYISLIKDGLFRIKDIVGKILQFARYEPTIEPLDIKAPLLAAYSLCEHRISGDKFSVESNLPDSLPSVMGDRGELQQVFLNLIGNALDAMPEGGKISFSITSNEKTLIVTINDSGCGMDENEIAKSFELFHTTKPQGEGTGLGLSIANDMITRMGGNLTITGKKGEGCVARVELPVVKE